MHRAARWAASLALGLAAWGCKPSVEAKAEAAEGVVRRFFSALPGGDCAVLGPLLAVETCREVVRDMQAHQMELVEVLDARVDGRNPEVVLVRVRLRKDGKVGEEPVVLRVERRPEGWRLRP